MAKFTWLTEYFDLPHPEKKKGLIMVPKVQNEAALTTDTVIHNKYSRTLFENGLFIKIKDTQLRQLILQRYKTNIDSCGGGVTKIK